MLTSYFTYHQTIRTHVVKYCGWKVGCFYTKTKQIWGEQNRRAYSDIIIIITIIIMRKTILSRNLLLGTQDKEKQEYRFLFFLDTLYIHVLCYIIIFEWCGNKCCKVKGVHVAFMIRFRKLKTISQKWTTRLGILVRLFQASGLWAKLL